MNKKDLELMARWISLNTEVKSADRLMCLQFSIDIATQSKNKVFNEEKFLTLIKKFDSVALKVLREREREREDEGNEGKGKE